MFGRGGGVRRPGHRGLSDQLLERLGLEEKLQKDFAGKVDRLGECCVLIGLAGVAVLIDLAGIAVFIGLGDKVAASEAVAVGVENTFRWIFARREATCVGNVATGRGGVGCRGTRHGWNGGAVTRHGWNGGGVMRQAGMVVL